MIKRSNGKNKDVWIKEWKITMCIQMTKILYFLVVNLNCINMDTFLRQYVQAILWNFLKLISSNIIFYCTFYLARIFIWKTKRGIHKIEMLCSEKLTAKLSHLKWVAGYPTHVQYFHDDKALRIVHFRKCLSENANVSFYIETHKNNTSIFVNGATLNVNCLRHDLYSKFNVHE